MENDEICLSPATLNATIKEALNMGEKLFKEKVLDILADQNCGHRGCDKCEAYEFLTDLIGGL